MLNKKILLLTVISLLFGCSIPGKMVITGTEELLSDITSRKWSGVAQIPDTIPFADSGWYRTNCFSFTVANTSGEAYYNWKSDIYSNGGMPHSVYFNSTTDINGQVLLNPIFEDKYFFVLRYNATNNNLWYQMKQNYAIQVPLSAIDTKTTNSSGQVDFTGYSIYIPVFVRNISTNNSKPTIEMNFGISFKPYLTSATQPTSKEIINDLFGANKDFYKAILFEDKYWVKYEEVNEIDDGANSCPNF